MLNHIKKFLAGRSSKTSKDNQGDDIFQTQLAAAVILLEAAHADEECTLEEMEHISATIQSTLRLSKDYTAELVELAHESRKHEVDFWQFTNQINNDFTHIEKLQIIEDVWRIILSDGHLEQHEDHFAHKLANLLRLTHKELINAKMKVKQEIESA